MSLQVWLPLNGDLHDQGLSNITVTNSNATIDNSGKIGKCYDFNGSNSKLIGTLPSTVIDNTTPIGSIAFWVRFDSFPNSSSWYNLVSIGSGEGYATTVFGIFMEYSNYINISINGSTSGENIYTHSLSTNTWYHLCTTYDGTTVKLYINGSEVLSKTATKRTRTSASNIFIGGTNSYWLDGKINDVRIYNHSLSAEEVYQISKGLVLHCTLSDPYVEGTTNLSNQGGCSGWNNSGTALRNSNDTTIPNTPETKCVSITQTSDGQSAIMFGTTNQNVPSKTLTASVWFWWTGNYDGSSVTPYIRSSSNDANLGNLEYNSNSNFTTWPKNTWIKLTKTFTTDSSITTVYFCAYTSKTYQEFAFSGWQIEEKDHATPYINGTRSQGIVYDSSGYCYNGSIGGTLEINNNTPRYNYCTNLKTLNDYIELPTSITPSLTTCSVSFWILIDGKGQSGWVPFGGQTEYEYFMATSGGTGAFYHSNIGSATKTIYRDGIVATNPLNDGKWHHYVMTGLDLHTWTKLYFNNYYHSTWHFRGKISDLRIYNTILTQTDITNLYSLGAQISA